MIAALALLIALGSETETESKKQRYLADKDLAPPTDCCAPGLQAPDADTACRTEPTCRSSPRAGDMAAQVLTARNLWTEERMAWSGPVVLDRTALGSFLRCHNTGLPGEHPAELVARVLSTAAKFGARRVEIVSGYRNAKYNLLLAKKGREVSRDSNHTRSQAIDFTLPGVDTEKVYRYLLKAHPGGVGYYPVSRFVHVDTGKKRTWRGT